MTTSTPEKADGLKALEAAIEKIKETIEGLGGVFKVQMAPKVVTATDEADLARKMERAEAENAEVSGDDEENDNEVGIKYKMEDEGDDKADRDVEFEGSGDEDDDNKQEE